MRLKKITQDLSKVIDAYNFEGFMESRLPKEKLELSTRSYVKHTPGLHLLLVIDGPNPVELDHYTRILGKVLNKLGGVLNERIVLGRQERQFKVMNFPGSEDLRCYKMTEFTHRRILDVGSLLHENIDIFLDYVHINVPVGGKVQLRRDSWFSFIAECKGIEVYKAYKQLELPRETMHEAAQKASPDKTTKAADAPTKNSK